MNNRAHKRLEKRRLIDWNTKLNGLIEKVVTFSTSQGLPPEDEKVLEVAEQCDNEWRNFIRSQQRGKYAYAVSDKKYRKKMLEKFIDMFNRYTELHNEQEAKAKEEKVEAREDGVYEDKISIQNKWVTVEGLKLIFKENNITTKARTPKGLFKVYSELSSDQKELIHSVL